MAASSAQTSVSVDPKTLAILAHVLGFFTSFVGPLVIMLVAKDSSPFAAEHAKEALNFQLTMLIGFFVSGLLMMIIIGGLLMLALFVIEIIFVIKAAMAASDNKPYHYPMTIHFVK